METHRKSFEYPQYLQASSCDPTHQNLRADPDQLVQLCVLRDHSSDGAPPGGRLYTQTGLYLSHWHQTVCSPDVRSPSHSSQHDDVTEHRSPSAEKLQELTLPSWPLSSVVLL